MNKRTSILSAPHAGIRARDERDRFCLRLFDDLWLRYRNRVSYVRAYEDVLGGVGASFVNDHIAFRTLACQSPSAGIHSIAPIFEALGYVAAACYHFPDKHLRAVHLQHPVPGFPKLFISELKLCELSEAGRRAALRSLRSHRPPVGDDVLADIGRLGRVSAGRRKAILTRLLRFFSELPWALPHKKDVLTLERESQYAAWTLVHGDDVNHFTASINSQGAALSDIDKTVAALRAAGIPMKSEIEGRPGSKLRQSATEAVVIPVKARQDGKTIRMPWTYAYFELAERGSFRDPETGESRRFEGFLGGQATHLFEMTRLRVGASPGR